MKKEILFLIVVLSKLCDCCQSNDNTKMQSRVSKEKSFDYDDENSNGKCGRRQVSVTGNIVGGQKVMDPTRWPWIVPLMEFPKIVFFCAGSLISNKHILSGMIKNFLEFF